MPREKGGRCIMKRRMILALFVLVPCLFSPHLWGEEKDSEKAAKADLKWLQGTWALTSAHRHGKDATAAMAKDYKITFREDLWIVAFEGRTPFDEKSFRIQLDPGKSPKEFDVTCPPLITSNAAPPTGAIKLPGIYRIEGDTLKLCWDVGRATGRRPIRFETEPGTEHLSLVLKRVKNKD